jgi:hypothetical protein
MAVDAILITLFSPYTNHTTTGDHDGAVDAFSEVLGYVQNDPLVFESRGLVLQVECDACSD